MSTYVEEEVRCPACDAAFPFRMAHGVNVTRRPEDRDALLDDTLQRGACPSCGEPLRADPRFTWLSLPDEQWILVEPAGNLETWAAFEHEAKELFLRTYGAWAPAAAQEIGASLRPRIVFGWAALREKVLCAEHGLDDVVLELVKLAIVREVPEQPIGSGGELRLVGVEGDTLLLAWLDAEGDAIDEVLRVPTAVHRAIASDEEWATLRDDLADGFFVDLRRFYVVEG